MAVHCGRGESKMEVPLKWHSTGRLALVLLLAGFSATSFASTPVTVQQVEELLAVSSRLADVKLGTEISGLELTVRASSARLLKWEGQFTGKRTRDALMALADASAFLELPRSDIPAIEKPDAEARKQIFIRAIDYVHVTLPKLPNFIARRSTTHFDDVSPMQRKLDQYLTDQANGVRSAMSPPSTTSSSGVQPMHIGDRSSVVVTYRDGREVADGPAEKDRKSDAGNRRFTTVGEFGPILPVVMGDVIHGKLYWGHWELGASGPLAVFRYTVPVEVSHYTLLGVGDSPQLPGYHGEIAVDPELGTIMRVTLVAEPRPPWQGWESSILVEYGPVKIGDGTYTCPLRAVALSRIPAMSYELNKENEVNPEESKLPIPARTFLNDVTFTDYHVFHADVRILP